VLFTQYCVEVKKDVMVWEQTTF